MSRTRGIFGPTSSVPFVFFDRDSSCWRTYQATFLSGSDEFSGTWPKSGTWGGGRAYGPRTSGSPTDGSGCSSSRRLLPTASSWMGRRPENARSDPERWGGDGKRSVELVDAITRLLPTPDASAFNDSQSIETVKDLLPTATAGDAKASGHRQQERTKTSHAGTTLSDVFKSEWADPSRGGSTSPRSDDGNESTDQHPTLWTGEAP